MKRIAFFVLLVISGIDSFSQSDPLLKFIFVPHPRTEDKVKQSVLPGIEKIDFTKFDMTMLGGDLTYYTSKNRIALNYCDSLFDLGSPNTLWCFGNHDVSNGNRALIKEYTGRESYYSYHRDSITFVVLDTELNANGFSNTFIQGDQLQMVKNVCDTISESGYLIFLHHRLIWMINNDYFLPKLDSVAASSKSLDTTNFYSEIYPLIRKVKSKGIQVICLGGDKSDINIGYSPEDSITFYASKMTTYFSDSVNNVLVLNYSRRKNTMTCDYVTLAELDKNNQTTFTLSVSADTVSLGAKDNATASVSITSNTSWRASSDQTWLTIFPGTETTGNAMLVLTAAANYTAATRMATVTLSAGGVTPKVITVIQAAYPGTRSEIKTEKTMSVYPNPVAGSFRVTGIDGNARLTLTDIHGRELFTKEITGDGQIPADFLSRGLYILKITTESCTSVRQILKE